MTASRSPRREDAELYQTVCALRRIGKRVYRVDRDHSRLGSQYLANTELIRQARGLLRPPVQLNLFDWGRAGREVTVEITW